MESEHEPRTAAGFAGLHLEYLGEKVAFMVQERGYRKASLIGSSYRLVLNYGHHFSSLKG